MSPDETVTRSLVDGLAGQKRLTGMLYRVVFAKRFESDGSESAIDPTADLDVYLADGVVADKVFIERFEPDSKHSQEALDEDDAFLGRAAPEVWEYDVVDDRASEFEDAIRNSRTVMEFEITDDSSTGVDDLSSDPIGDTGSTNRDHMVATDGVSRGGSGVRGVDDGPGGQSTGDASAGGLGSGVLEEDEGLTGEGSGGIDELTIVTEDDPNLGLTDHGKTGPDDWAANQGPTRTPNGGVKSEGLRDKRSTLSPDRR